jgi:acyl-CoA hydrolase
MKVDIKYVSPQEALSVIKSGDRVFMHGSAQTPVFLVNELAKEADRLKDVEIVSISVYGDLEICKPEYQDSFRMNSMFVSGSIREAVTNGRADYIPVFLSEIPELFKRNILPLDVAILQVSVPDEHGYCSLGVSVDVARSAVNTAKKVIAQVNPNAPRTHGDGMIHASRFHAMVYCEDPMQETSFAEKVGEGERKIGNISPS